ncbi:Hypothetical predicted protein [Octopus vulgaris]|uniref:Uncharacterized protein n=1 Tax=Octopus vulgaris TaxID=6645 RepID=A0AA36BZF8_OCTVU|nr:Hypothetical predicted protein [Octopus vulgaris]
MDSVTDPSSELAPFDNIVYPMGLFTCQVSPYHLIISVYSIYFLHNRFTDDIGTKHLLFIGYIWNIYHVLKTKGKCLREQI